MNTQRDRDLFGVPLDPHHGRKGRPRHKPTDAMRQWVRELRERGATLPEIAAALHITEPTLALHYRAEVGWRRRRQESTNEGKTDMQTQETLRRLETNEFFRVGAKAAGSGAGRAARFASALALLPLEDRNLMLAALDEITRPMTARELEKALMQTDLGMTHRKAVVAALKGFDIVLVSKS